MPYDFRWENEYELPCYPKREVAIVRGKGARVWDNNNKEYIDCVSGHGVAFVGHGNEKVIAAIQAQAEILITCPGTFYNDQRQQLLKKLTEICPSHLTKFFFTNSGTECIEAAIKFARLATGKSDFISTFRGFHGRSLGALSATHNPKYRQDFLPLLPGFSFVPFNNYEKMAQAVNDNTAGIILEIVQGEGGVYIADQSYLEQVQHLGKEKNILLIIDEVQTGLGRTGKIFACQHFDLKPDILCLAKSLAGGLPMGVVMCTDQIPMKPGKHGSTFGGSPLVCAAAIATIDYLVENDLAGQAAQKGAYILDQLQRLNTPIIRQVRGLGLMIGIDTRVKVKPIILKLMEEGLLTLPAGANIIRLLPPAIISYEEIDKVIDIITRVLPQFSLQSTVDDESD